MGQQNSSARTRLALIMATAMLTLSQAVNAAPPSQGRWAADTDPIARRLIEQERRWATDGCTPSTVVRDFIAPDFVGTSPAGGLYSRAALLQRENGKSRARDCKLLAAQVRFYGPDLAVIYGNESAVVAQPDGTETTHILIWTDTAVRRAGKWQVIAVQDMVAPPGWKPADWHVPE